MLTIPRPEHPRAQFERSDWVNLNGTWSCVLDNTDSGLEKGYPGSQGFDDPITVPFCPESTLSGLGHTGFILGIWYHRTMTVPAEWNGAGVVLHFGGVDYETTVFIDGKPVARHWGGSCGFEQDITPFVRPGSVHHLVVHARDNLRSWEQPAGKQSMQVRSHGCHYTRTTGIWQTVWIERVHPRGLSSCTMVPDLEGGRVLITPHLHTPCSSTRLQVRALLGEETVGWCSTPCRPGIPAVLELERVEPWSPHAPTLYTLELSLQEGDGNVIDTVRSYTGLRTISVDGNRLLLNNEPLFLRLVLDQGFYPDGIWTAPDDAALRRDIELAMEAGFNGARLHQKVFEERFHYWADRLGYLTWGEFPSWGVDITTPAGGRAVLSEWRSVVVRDRNHPSIIAWTPFNETDPQPGEKHVAHNRVVADTVALTRALDPTRPINDCSGWVHVETDIWTVHDYEQNPRTLAEKLEGDDNGAPLRNRPDCEPPYQGQPYVVDEYGGIRWVPDRGGASAADGWGYGDAPRSDSEFYERLEGLTKAILANNAICGYCYTQLTDVEQERNGIYFYDRTPKGDMERVRSIFTLTPDWSCDAPGA